MRERIKGLAALWIVFALILSAPPVTVMAADDWQSTRPKDKVYVYTGSEEITPDIGIVVESEDITSGLLEFDIPFDEQAETGDQTNFMNQVTIPNGYDLKEWKVWSFAVSGMMGRVSGEPRSIAKNGPMSEREYDDITNYLASESIVLLMLPVMVCKPPVVKISISGSSDEWQTLSGGVSFQTFLKATQNVTVSAEDVGSGIKSVQYYLSNTDLFPENKTYTAAEIEGTIPAWTGYTGAVNLSADGKYILYAKAVDQENNVTYASTAGIVIDGTAPVISVQGSGAVHEGDTVSFTVSDDYLDKVTVDGDVVTADNGVYELTASKKTHKIAATDKAGNSASETIKVEMPGEENGNISSGGKFSLTAGKAYSLGAGTWKVAGDDTVYEGGITFYVGESGEYDFQKQ